MALPDPVVGVARRRAVLAMGGAVVLLRLTYLVAPEGNDEGGYLAIARQWHAGGPSLYGRYWVDRPPVLIALFQLADLAGGLPALRVIGAVAAALATLGVAVAAARVAGRRAAVWSAAVTAALLASPQLGTVQVNGELLAAPFVAWSIAGWLYAGSESGSRRSWAAAGAGALAIVALLVKQNMAEPLVFGLALAIRARRSGTLPTSQVRRLVLAGMGGGAGALVAATAWTLAHGTSPRGVLDATYLFRLRAADVLATTANRGQVHRSTLLVTALLTSGLTLPPLLLLGAWARRRVRGPVVPALVATLAWSTFSVLAGGGFWDHYLVELVVPVGLAVAILVGQRAPARRAFRTPALLAALLVTVALGHWVAALGSRGSDTGQSLGAAIAASARPGDTLVSAVGDAQTVDASGLASPYPYLWTLPAQVEDPQLLQLSGLLRGPTAPTWIVTWHRPTLPASALARFDAAVAAGYRPVANLCGHAVYLSDGVDRPPLQPTGACSAPFSVLWRLDVDEDRW